MIRIVVLLGMTAYAYRKIGKRAAAVPAAALLVVGVLALMVVF